jgi:hypothetical protein
MKYLRQHQNMQQQLATWQGSDSLVTASFFFWRMGTALQKTQTGLLRSLLFQILDAMPELVPLLFPGVCRSMKVQSTFEQTLTFHELRQALSTLLSNIPRGTKLFVFIDGIDEYEGNQQDVLDLFVDKIRGSNVKVLVSSRPTPVCQEAFEQGPGLRLQDLTVGDIRFYANELLSGHRLMQEMEATTQGRGVTQQLISEIIYRASGVFLWVILVVKDLREGLRDGDTREILLHRLRRLPHDLELLYEHMFETMSDDYQKQASMLIQLVMRSMVKQQTPMTVLQLSFAEEYQSQPQSSLDVATQELSEDQQTLRCNATIRRLRSRCCGLLEAQRLTRSRGTSELSVGFLHRTVDEFLHREHIQRHLKALTADVPINHDEILLSSNLVEMKARPDRAMYSSVPHILSCAPSISRTLQHAYLKSMETTSSRYESNGTLEPSWQWDLVAEKGGFAIDTQWNPDLFPHPYHVLLAQNGLHHALRHTLRRANANIHDKLRLLLHLVLSLLHLLNAEVEDSVPLALVSSIKMLLEDGVDSNSATYVAPASLYVRSLTQFNVSTASASNIYASTKGQFSPWFCCIQATTAMISIKGAPRLTIAVLCVLLSAMLDNGAALTLSMRYADGSSKTARMIVERFIARVDRDGVAAQEVAALSNSLAQATATNGRRNQRWPVRPNGRRNTIPQVKEKKGSSGGIRRFFS